MFLGGLTLCLGQEKDSLKNNFKYKSRVMAAGVGAYRIILFI